jgi:hypothetical protein
MKQAVKLLSVMVLLLIAAGLSAQNTLTVSGLNETEFIYRTAADSLNAYFRDSFGFNLGYRNLSFGMKFIAELPKYSVNQDELIDELAAPQLSLGWKELYLRYNRDNLLLQAGTLSETFGSGMLFRAWEDIEFDEDNRLQAFMIGYDRKIKAKAFYGAVPSESLADTWDLAYGADFLYPVFSGLNLGASALALRSARLDGAYDQRDVFGARMQYGSDLIDASAEYAITELYKREAFLDPLDGSGLFASVSVNLYPVQVGLAGKRYENFSYRLQDLPLANYHNEPLEDTNSGISEAGLQGWASWTINDEFSTSLDYAEAWNLDQTIFMNDLHGSLDYSGDNLSLGAEYSHIEKSNDDNSTWQKELTPAVYAAFPAWGRTLSLKAEHKYIEKQKMGTTDGIYQAQNTSHWEPHLQADISFGKLSLSASASSHWTEMGELMNSRYWTNLEAKYAVFSHTDFTLFVGKEAGGKVCRNGICRYVAPFEGLKLEITTRF